MNGCKEDNVMKRLSIIAVTAIAALLSASCNKSIETPVVPAPQGSIILDLDITGFEGTGDTRAVKNDWAVGDKLNLWFDDWNYTAQANNPTPDLVITYDGSKWTAGELAAGRSLRPSGKFSVMYEGFNDLSEYTPDFFSISQFFRPHKELYAVGKVYFMPLVCVCDGINYNGINYTYADNKLSATISGWQTPTALKVLVKDLNSADAESYILQTANVTTSGTKYASCVGGIAVSVSNSCPTFGHGSSNYKGYVGGVPDKEGVAFYYNSCNFTSGDIEFRLFKKNASGNFEKTAKAPKFTGKTLVAVDSEKTIGVAIDNSKFE